VVANIDTVSIEQNPAVDLVDLLSPLIAREMAAIGALDAAVWRQRHPDYVVLMQDAKTDKQANIEQMSTVIRMAGGVPPERALLRTMVQKAQAVAAERSGTTAVLEAMRGSEFALLERYSDAFLHTHGPLARALRTALNRTIVHLHIITAHIAKRTNDAREAARLPLPLDRYFVGSSAKACMRCHFDRPGSRKPLERTEPHPYTYVCAGCHDDAIGELPEDLSALMPHWPEEVREARAIQHALGRGSKLHAAHTVLHELSGIAPDPPTRATEKARRLPELPAPPVPAEPAAQTLSIDAYSEGEREYVAALFDYRSVRASW
jgi:hypothetical protein